MSVNKYFRGRKVYKSGDVCYLARGSSIYISSDNGLNWKLWCYLPANLFRQLAIKIPFLARLFRLGVHHLVFIGQTAVVIFNKRSFIIKSDIIKDLGPLNGSRPMVLCATRDAVYYGEYRSNAERSEVSIWCLDIELEKWLPVWRFTGVRHIHGVFYDPFAKSIWVTTGDEDEESAIWRTDDHFATLHRVVGGSQQLRVVQLLFSKNYIFFGSDAPNEPNHIYRMHRDNFVVERVAAVGGSVFYGCVVGDSLFFSTAVEPSLVNKSRYAEVWRSDDGENWRKVLEFKKDSLPMKYFQYGQVLFPNGVGDGKNLFCTPFATESHGVTVRYSLEEKS